MTPEEIKKIAEEYVNNPYPNGLDKIIDIELFLEWLSERFYLVEKGKVEELYELCLLRENEVELGQKFFLQGGKKCMIQLFGPGIRKEEEE